MPQLKAIEQIAAQLGLTKNDLTAYGDYCAKVRLSVLNNRSMKGKMVLVTSTTPTPQGEGKTVTSIGISEGLNYIGKNAIACIRQPSMGPVFGQKGGAAGGGKAEVLPMEQLNLHLTGDIHSLTAAHNLAAAAIDARLYHETRLGEEFEAKSGMKRLNIDKNRIVWSRVIDQNDRALRKVTLGESPKNGDCIHEGHFEITAASELMAILALSLDLQDMRHRIGKVILAYDMSGNPITAEALKVAGAMTAILKQAIEPSFMQTYENTPVLIHAGPFANIAHGNSSIIADRIGLSLADYIVTEAGFGSDMGMEKFFNIKARVAKVFPSCIVIVSTVKSLKYNSTLDKNIDSFEHLKDGVQNLGWHIENAKSYGLPVIVAINRFPQDTDEEIHFLKTYVATQKVYGCEISEAFAKGGEGCEALSQLIVNACNEDSNPHFLYEDSLPLEDKIKALANRYGASSVKFSEKALKDIALFTQKGYQNLPICMVKTPLSITHDPKIKNRPAPFELPINALELAAGAGFIKAFAGDAVTMPGLGLIPSYQEIDIDADGNIVGL